jgi:hypothetical protein
VRGNGGTGVELSQEKISMNNTYASLNDSYVTIVNNQDQALCHLFFHCCLKDERFTKPETEDIAGKLVALGLPERISVGKELDEYRAYKPSITDEQGYLEYLFRLIKPVNELALYSYCAELCTEDQTLDPLEEALLRLIAESLELGEMEAQTINRLVTQRKTVEIHKIF